MLTFLTHPVVLLSLGGAVGANARWWLGVWVHDHKWTTHFPLATLLINVSGSLLLGLFFVPVHYYRWPSWWLLLGVGFCGGYTTFSTFSLETVALIRNGHRDVALAYVVASVAAGCVVMWLALAGMESIYPQPASAPPVMEAEDSETQTEP